MTRVRITIEDVELDTKGTTKCNAMQYLAEDIAELLGVDTTSIEIEEKD